MISSSPSPSPLNLEQQRKRAKDLLRSFRAGKPAAAKRIREHLPRAQRLEPQALLTSRLSLAEAQFVLAREAGFSSWPRFKETLESLDPAGWLEQLMGPAMAGQDEKALQIARQAALSGNPWAAAVLAESALLFRLLDKDPSLAASCGGPLEQSLLFCNCSARFGRDVPEIVVRRVEIAERLLELGADPNDYATALETEDGRMSVLAASVEKIRSPQLANSLLQHGANSEDFNALGAAAKIEPSSGLDHLACLRVLLRYGPPAWQLNGALGISLGRDDPAAIRLLLENGANPKNSGGWGGKGSLQHLALWRQRSVEVLRVLLQAGVATGIKDREGRTPLQIAERLGLLDHSKLLLEHGADPGQLEATDRLLASCWKDIAVRPNRVPAWQRGDHQILAWAAEQGRFTALSNLLAVGLDPTVPDDLGDTALHHTARQGAVEEAQILNAGGASLEARNLSGQTALDAALLRPPGTDRTQVVDLLLEHGATANTLLAFPTGEQALDKVLRAAGAVEREDLTSRFESAAEAVVSGKEEQLLQLLEEEPTLVTARSPRPHRSTLLHYVAANGIETERQKTPPNAVAIGRILLDAGAEPDALCATYGGGPAQTTLALLVSSGWPAQAGLHGPLVKLLCQAGARPDGIDEDGIPLATAIAFRHRDAVDALVTAGARLSNILFAAAAGNVQRLREDLDEQGQLHPQAGRCQVPWLPMPTDPREAVQQALVHAAQLGRFEMVRYLVEGVGIDPNQAPVDGITGCHEAAFMGHEAVVRYLLEQGADPNLRERRYHSTCLGWAKEGKRETIARLLIDAHPADIFDSVEYHLTDRVLQLLDEDPTLISAPDGQGAPLRIAAAYGHLDLVKLLLARGAHPAQANQHGLKPIDYARRGKHSEIVELLEEMKASS